MGGGGSSGIARPAGTSVRANDLLLEMQSDEEPRFCTSERGALQEKYRGFQKHLHTKGAACSVRTESQMEFDSSRLHSI